MRRVLRLEREVGEIAKKYGIKVIGPNCLGIMSSQKDNIMNSTFLKITPKFGNIALVSQSGAICAAVEDAEARTLVFQRSLAWATRWTWMRAMSLSSWQKTKTLE